MEFIKSPNFSSRNGKKIEYVVIHWFGVGTINGAIASFQNPSRQASAHYLISDKRVVQMVDEKDCAWHCGNLDMNQRSIGIENDANPDKELSEASYRTCGKLLREICDRYQIPLDREHIKRHSEIKKTQCCGTISVEKLIEIAKGDEVTEQECQKRIKEALKGKYDENHIRSLLSSCFHDMRDILLGEVDAQGLEDDVNYRYRTIEKGSQTAFADQFKDYMKAGNLQWIKATDVASKVESATIVLEQEINNLKEDLDEQAGLFEGKIDKAVKEACKTCPKVEIVRYETIWEFIKRKLGK